LAAVPLAVLLDRLGFFRSLAQVMTQAGRGDGGLWILAALVTTVLNLDAAVVLLTPLYVRVARQTGRDPLTLASQPVLLACLASSALPVSNLTNLIAASWTSAGSLDFVTHLALPSVAATAVGWVCYRRLPAATAPTSPEPSSGAMASIGEAAAPAHEHRRAITRGGVVVALVLVGFVAGGPVGIQPWMVALGADAVLLVIVREVPWGDIPWATAILALSLGVLAAAAVLDVNIAQVVGGTSTAALARTIGVSALGANAINNLPALLVCLPALGHHHTSALWAVLIGVNMGPVLLSTGSLASLLWLDTLNRLDVAARPRDFTRVGVRVGLPGAVAGAGVFLAISAL
jgi:arsenical pump membrane protein